MLCSAGILGSTIKSVGQLILKTEQIIILNRKLSPEKFNIMMGDRRGHASIGSEKLSVWTPKYLVLL